MKKTLFGLGITGALIFLKMKTRKNPSLALKLDLPLIMRSKLKSNPIHWLVGLFIVLGLATGCTKSGTSSSTPENKAGQAPIPGPSLGGIDSSGGDALASTPEQVDEALKDLDVNVRKVLHRMVVNILNVKRLEFDDQFGVGSYALIKKFLSAKKGNLEVPLTATKQKQIQYEIRRDGPCVAQGVNHDGSSYVGSIQGDPKVCISFERLRKLPPESLRLQIVALALHEISHHYGFTESEAVALQKFVVQNQKITWPEKALMKENIEMFRNARLHTALAQTQFVAKSRSQLCQEISIVKTSLNTILIQSLGREASFPLPKTSQNSMAFANMALLNVHEACEKEKDEKVFSEFARSFEPMFYGYHYTLNLLLQFDDYQFKPDYLPVFPLMDMLEFMASKEYLDQEKVKPVDQKNISMDQIVCRMRKFAEGETEPLFEETDRVKKFYSREEGDLGRVFSNGDRDFSMAVRKRPKSLGVQLGILSKNFEVLKKKKGYLGETGDGQPAFVGFFAPKISENIQLLLERVEAPKDRIEIVCEKKALNDEKPPEFQKWPEESTATITSEDPSDSHFDVNNPSVKIEMWLREGENREPIRAYETTISKLRFSGLVIITDKKAGCIITDELAIKSGTTAQKISEMVRDGKVNKIICYKNGVADGDEYHSAPWAYKFQMQ